MKRLFPLLLLVCLSGCGTWSELPYLAAGQWQLLRDRQPVADLVNDPQMATGLRERLLRAQAARNFASQQLGLPDNGSYRDYVELQRPYVVWNLFATPAYSLTPLTHCFPLAGCVAYRGFFQPGRARGAAALLAREGWDTAVVGVEAYSTLGWFADPLLSSMLRRSDDELAGVIFHELAHQQLYVPGDTVFNESFASFVEREGLRQWRQAQGIRPADPQAEQQRREFIGLILASRQRLEQLYAAGGTDAELEAGKQAEFARLRRAYRDQREHAWSGDRRYDAWMAAPLNNARLLPFGLYEQWVPAFERLYADHGNQWPGFYAAVAALAALPAEQREQQLRRLTAPRRG